MNDDNRYAPPRAPVADTVPSSEQTLAGRGTRLAAALIDGVLLGLLLVPYTASTKYWERVLLGQMDMSGVLQMSLATLIGFLVLHAYLLHKHGQTIGKRLLGIRIVSASSGEILSLGKIFGLRYAPMQLVAILPVIGFLVPVIDVLFIFREDRRCLHDFIAGTKVVKVG